MKTLTKIALQVSTLLSMTFAVSAQDQVAEKTFDQFTGIDVSSTFKVYFTQGASQKVLFYSKNGDVSKLSANVKNGKLYLDKNEDNICSKVEITLPNIDLIDAHGVSEFKSTSPIVSKSLMLDVHGSSSVDIEVQVETLNTEVHGSGELRIKGNVNNHKTFVHGAAVLKAVNLITQNTEAKVSGAGDAKVNAVDNLNADISGAGTISYKDEPKQKSINVSGAGNVRNGKSNNNDSTINKVNIDAYGQSDTVKIRLKNKNIIILDKNKSKKDKSKKVADPYHHWAGFDLGYTIIGDKNLKPLTGANANLNPKDGNNFNFRINFLEKDINLYQEKINLVTGLGIEWFNYGLKNDVIINPDQTTVTTTNSLNKFSKNKLLLTYINAPLILEFNTSNKITKSFHLAVGALGGVRVGAKNKQEYAIGNSKYEVNVKDDFNIQRFKLSALARVGYGKITVWGDYNLLGFFNSGQGPKVQPLTFGLTIVPFD